MKNDKRGCIADKMVLVRFMERKITLMECRLITFLDFSKAMIIKGVRKTSSVHQDHEFCRKRLFINKVISE